MTNEDYAYTHDGWTGTADAVSSAAEKALAQRCAAGARVLELGCGNGHFARRLSTLGYAVTGIDPSVSGIAQATAAHPGAHFRVADTGNLAAQSFEPFDALISVEVIEHVPSVREYCAAAWHALRPGGVIIVTTPYHGYFKNLAIALLGRHDRHFDPLWEGGHLKFFSMATMSKAFADAGFRNIRFERVGRIPPVAKSLVMCAERPL